MPRPHSARAVLLALALLLLVAAPASAESLTATSGTTSATLTWRTASDGLPSAEDVSLAVTRSGVVTTPALACDFCMLIDDPSTLQVTDLDADAAPEVVVSRFSGGAHCCTDALVYAPGATTPLVVETGNQGFRIVDLDGDGRPEIETRDDRFAAAFTAYAASAAPLRVLRYGAGTVTDVSRAQRRAVRTDAGRLREELRKLGRDQDHRGLLAAYVADEYLGARGTRGRRELDREVRLGLVTKGFRRLLLRELRAWGYR